MPVLSTRVALPSILPCNSQSGVVVMRKFISYIRDIQQGRDEVSVLSQSLDYINAEDVKSDVVWETLRTDLKTSGLSTRMLNKHRASIVAKFGELLETGSIDSQEQPAESNEESTSPVAEPDDDIYGTESEDFGDGTQWDFSTPEVLLLAARSGRLDITKKAIDAWPSLDTTDRQGNTALHLASAGGHVGVVEVLLEKGSDPNIKSRRGGTAICQALENGHHAVIKCIINLSPNKETINARVDGLAHTALHYAASLGDEDSVSLLLTAGADPNILNGFNQTPLHLAASKRELIVVKSLLDADSDLGVEDFWGDTAFEVAISTPFNERNKDGIIRVFLEHRVMLLEAKGETLSVDFDSAAQFLAMESIYNANSSENIFKLSAQGGDISQLLPKQFERNDLAEDLWEAFY